MELLVFESTIPAIDQNAVRPRVVDDLVIEARNGTALARGHIHPHVTGQIERPRVVQESGLTLTTEQDHQVALRVVRRRRMSPRGRRYCARQFLPSAAPTGS